MTAACRQQTLSGKGTKSRLAAVVLVTVAVLSCPGARTDSWAQANLPRVGIITVGAVSDPASAGHRLDLIRRAFASQGWSEGKNIAFELRDARGDASRNAAFAAEFVRQKVDLIWADSAPALHATYAATRTIPIVASDYTTDPVTAGYALSYGRPGKNVTGVFLDAPEFSGKWLELLKEMVPGLSRVAVLWDPSPGTAHVRGIEAVAPSLGIQIQQYEVRKPEEIDAAASTFRGWPQALVILPSPMLLAESPRLAGLAARQRLPATSIFRLFAEKGGLSAYGPVETEVVDRVAIQATKILRGAKPGDLPIERPSNFELTVNLRAARALGITIPQSILMRADKVIR
jgi:putative ABC transport system substrate-binding protein